MGTDWAAVRSQEASAWRDGARPEYMTREGAGSIYSGAEGSVWTESPHSALTVTDCQTSSPFP